MQERGLIVSLTRFVHFGELPKELREKYEANVYIDCSMMAHTRPGIPAKEVFQKGIDAIRKRVSRGWKLHIRVVQWLYGQRLSEFILNRLISFRRTRPLPGIHRSPGQIGRYDSRYFKGTGNDHMAVLYPTIIVEVEGTTFTRPDIFEKK